MSPEALIAVILGTGGLSSLLAAYIAKRKTKPELAAVVVESATKVVVMQDQWLEDQKAEVDRLRIEMEKLRKFAIRVEALQRRIETLEEELRSKDRQIETLKRENRRQRERISALEANGKDH